MPILLLVVLIQAPTEHDIGFAALQECQVRAFLPRDPGRSDASRCLRPIPAHLLALLGSPRHAEREAASSALVDLGWAALPALLWGLAAADPEVRDRAGVLLDALLRREYPCSHCGGIGHCPREWGDPSWLGTCCLESRGSFGCRQCWGLGHKVDTAKFTQRP
jgi:hypothetical protein